MHTAERRRTTAERLGLQFLDEVQAAIAPFEIYGDAHEALWQNLFRSVRPFDFVADRPLARPHPLQLLVESYIFYAWFRAWVRKQGMDPASLRVTASYPFTTAHDKKYPDDDDEG